MKFKVKHKQSKRAKTIKAVLFEEQKLADSVPTNTPTYFNINAPPSLLPAGHWCDITGLPAPYKTKSGLRFYNKEVYQLAQNMPAAAEQEYLKLRKANTIMPR